MLVENHMKLEEKSFISNKNACKRYQDMRECKIIMILG